MISLVRSVTDSTRLICAKVRPTQLENYFVHITHITYDTLTCLMREGAAESYHRC